MSENLLFIRHSVVQIEPEKPAGEWRLSEVGRSRAHHLASQLKPYNLSRIISSTEPKAIETGQIIADELDLPHQTALNLYEHDREGVPFFKSGGALETAVTRFFQNPDTLVFGNETANQAFERFDTAVSHLIAIYPDDTLAIVTHGTVLTLFLAHYNDFSPLPFWQKIKLPDYFVVSLPDMTLVLH